MVLCSRLREAVVIGTEPNPCSGNNTLPQTTSTYNYNIKEITMYYRIKNCIFDLLDVAAVESVYESGWCIIIAYKSTKHISRIQFGYLEDRDTAFDALCDALLKQEAM